MTIFEWNGQYDTSFFQKKNRTLSFWPSMLPHKVVLPQTPKSTREQFWEISVSKCVIIIDASSIIHIDASWRDGDMVFRLEKKSQWVCDVLPFLCRLFASHSPHWAIMSHTSPAFRREFWPLSGQWKYWHTYQDGPTLLVEDSWTLTTDVAMSLWSTKYSLFSIDVWVESLQLEQ